MKVSGLLIIFSIGIISFWSCNNSKKKLVPEDYYNEKHRSQFHFSPEANWMNDPNGMVFYEDEYHLFYQYYPDSTVWGPMHWGHAISTDLVHWNHLPIALYPDEHGLIFSGSAVVDWNNTSGFGIDDKPPLVAIFSYHDMEKEKAGDDDFQTQGIAYSNDKGRTWTTFKNNPVIKNPGVRDFRDPKVIWHKESKQWVMAVAALDHLMIYSSLDLKKWNLQSEFGKDIGNHDGVWECPDLFPLKSDTGEEYWVLIQNMGTGNPNGGSGTQYFIGQFDGKEFTMDENFMKLLGKQKAVVPEGKVFDSFEEGFANWSVEGTAFGSGPVNPNDTNQKNINGIMGKKLVSSFNGDNSSKGKMTSKTFIIKDKAINFLVSGGNHRGRTFIGLFVDGKQVRQAEGRNNENLEWSGWDVSGFKGKKAHIEIIDNYKGDWGHINIDEITFSEVVASAEKTKSVWLDAGRDNYAGVTWSDIPDKDGRRIFLGWMSNWAYAQVVPTTKWRSAMTIPWTLEINHVDGIPRLVGKPIKELEKLAKGEWQNINFASQVPKSGLYELLITANEINQTPFSFELSNKQNEKISFNYSDGIFSLDRTKSGNNSFSPDFPGVHTTTRISDNENLKIHAFVDHSSIDIFLDDGQNVFTDLFFPSELYTHIKIKGNGEFQLRELKGIWK